MIDFVIHQDDSLWYDKRLCIPNDYKLKREIMEEAHGTTYSINPRRTKMYKDLKEYY